MIIMIRLEWSLLGMVLFCRRSGNRSVTPRFPTERDRLTKSSGSANIDKFRQQRSAPSPPAYLSLPPHWADSGSREVSLASSAAGGLSLPLSRELSSAPASSHGGSGSALRLFSGPILAEAVVLAASGSSSSLSRAVTKKLVD